jgi:hypothetical protein
MPFGPDAWFPSLPPQSMADPSWASPVGGNATSAYPWHVCLEDSNQQVWYVIFVIAYPSHTSVVFKLDIFKHCLCYLYI